MIAIAYYLLKVLICSSVLFLYYQVALRNKLFHQWNRYYLLLTVLCSLFIPLFEFTLFTAEKSAQPIQLLQVVYSADEYVAQASSSGPFFSFEQVSYGIYAFVSLIFLFIFFASLYKIYNLIRSHSVQSIQAVKFINTDVKGTPFSFLHFIFWNQNINIHTSTGQQIFQHELVHVKEKHTLDKIFLQIVLSFFWWNPVFWLVRNELKMIHEFIADKKAVGQADSSAFAAMILKAAYPQHSFNNMTNQFFQSSIKRRLSMLTKQKKQKLSYASRVLALPLIAVLIFAFTIKTKSPEGGVVPLDKAITVVIDAGHGGNTGAQAGNVYEDDLVLQLAKAIKAANNNSQINLVFTRETENNIDLQERVAIAKRNKADLFISLHMNAAVGNSKIESGIEVKIPSKNPPYQKQSELLGSALLGELKAVYPSASDYSLRKTQIWVLDKNVCPAVIIECGYFTNEKDRQFMAQPENQKLIARQILTAIERYAASGNTGAIKAMSLQPSNIPEQFIAVKNTQEQKKDTADNPLVYIDGVKKGRLKELGGLDKLMPIDAIKVMHVYKGKDAVDKYGKDGSDGVIELITKNAAPPPPPPPANVINIKPSGVENPLIIIDGKESGRLKDGKMKDLSPNTIESLNVLKGESAEKIYGEKGKQGVIEITTKKAVPPPPPAARQSMQLSEPEKAGNIVFEQVEKPAQFPGGDKAWRKFMQENANSTVPSDNGAKEGTYKVEITFVVNKEGELSNLKTLTNHGYGMEEEVERFMKLSPNWIPATQNGNTVSAFTKQAVTFVVQEQ